MCRALPSVLGTARSVSMSTHTFLSLMSSSFPVGRQQGSVVSDLRDVVAWKCGRGMSDIVIYSKNELGEYESSEKEARGLE